jgi:site-specific recombinase XerD
MRANTLQDYNDDLEKARKAIEETEYALKVYEEIYAKFLAVLRDSEYMANGPAEKAVSRAITDAFQAWQEETKV